MEKTIKKSNLKSSLFEPVEKEIALVEETLKETTEVEYPWLTDLLDYIVDSGGKRIRPALTLLCGKFHHYNLDTLIPMAAGVELLHTATLVHDDTIDKSDKRRGKPTASNIWGGGIAILAGDYVFAQSAELVARTGNLRVIKLFAHTLMALCTGELGQNLNSYNPDETQQGYFSRIAHKTASLFSTATESAGVLSQAPEKAIQSLKNYGHNLGMAFQIADDILDFTADENKLGKPVGSDLIQGTMTLPSILLREWYPNDTSIEDVFKNNGHNGDNQQQSLDLAIDIIHNSDIIPECYRVARTFVSNAQQAIEEFPENASKQALVEIANHAVARQA